eukprot:g63804.t1
MGGGPDKPGNQGKQRAGADRRGAAMHRGGGKGTGGSSSGSGFKRTPSFLDKLKSGEKKIDNPRDAEQLFKQLLKHKAEPETMVLLFEDSLTPAMATAIRVLLPSVTLVLELLSALGEERLSHGVFRVKPLQCFGAIFGVPDFLRQVLTDLETKRMQDPAPVAWALLKLPEVDHELDMADAELRIRSNKLACRVAQLLQASNARGLASMQPALANMFASPDTSSENKTPSMSFKQLSSLAIARQAMRRPGVREHDNDKENFREIGIAPTSSELMCDEEVVHQQPEMKLLDRQFRLLREDLIGPMREELRDELKRPPADHRRLYRNPTLTEIDFKPQPHFKVQVSMTPLLQRRAQCHAKKGIAQDFF